VKNSNPTTPHTFTVTGQSIDITNDAGQSQTVTINLPAGTYPFICRFHQGLGMKGTLTVT
jgi:plastocyanin